MTTGAMLVTISLFVPSAVANCNNYGTQIIVGDYDCQIQHCDQGSGAGAGAGAGGPGENEASAGASAGTECSQSGGGGSGGTACRAFIAGTC